jgi:hypothetical protein
VSLKCDHLATTIPAQILEDDAHYASFPVAPDSPDTKSRKEFSERIASDNRIASDRRLSNAKSIDEAEKQVRLEARWGRRRVCSSIVNRWQPPRDWPVPARRLEPAV